MGTGLPTYDTIRCTVDGHVGRLVLNRPERLNSFTIAMWRELADLGARLLDDPGEIRALVVVGEGRAFSSGIDTSVFSDGSGDQLVAEVGAAPRHDDSVV